MVVIQKISWSIYSKGCYDTKKRVKYCETISFIWLLSLTRHNNVIILNLNYTALKLITITSYTVNLNYKALKLIKIKNILEPLKDNI